MKHANVYLRQSGHLVQNGENEETALYLPSSGSALQQETPQIATAKMFVMH